ncbi:MAG: hypothetical protein Q9220_007085 [cf. Caloplaca sp. 1 TL-2023]
MPGRSILSKFGSGIPLRLSLFTEEVLFVTGADNLKLVWKNSQWLTAKAGHMIGLSTILGTPAKSLEFYKADNSGIGKTPIPHSHVAPEHRVWHLTHQPITDCLSGQNLDAFTESFQAALSQRIEDSSIGDEWVEMPDLYHFIYTEVIHVQLELLCGSFFLEQNPNFAEDFKRFNEAMAYLKKGLPGWMTPQSVKARNVCLDSVKKWHKALIEHDPDRLVDTGERQHPRFGNEIMRSRRLIMAKMDAMDEETAASADLGMLWALNANPVTASFWVLLEFIRDPSLHTHIHHAIRSATSPSPSPSTPTKHESTPYISTSTLLTSPLLQSIYAETLRLRVSVMIVQSAEFSDFKFKEWVFPKDKLILISSRIAHMDAEAWNTGTHGEYPLDRFWAERFLVWPGRTDSGPLKKKGTTIQAPTKSAPTPLQPLTKPPQPLPSDPKAISNKYSTARFSTSGLTGHWIPYGGGPGICPGRHFAKANMLLAAALFFSAFEFSLPPPPQEKKVKEKQKWEEERPEMNLRFYGLGVLPPRGTVPCNIKRRK